MNGNIFQLVFRLNPITYLLNFRYFPFRDAIKLPIFVFGKVCIQKLKGNIIINKEVKTGMITIGEQQVGIFDQNLRTTLNIHGNLCFNGTAKIGRCSSISIGKGGTLNLGNVFNITGRSSIIASGDKSIVIGNNCLISWDVLIMNTDFHKILDIQSKNVLNRPQDVKIGDDVWIGCRSLVLKGARIPNSTIIAANTILSKSLYDENCIYGGIKAQKLKDGVSWQE